MGWGGCCVVWMMKFTGVTTVQVEMCDGLVVIVIVVCGVFCYFCFVIGWWIYLLACLLACLLICLFIHAFSFLKLFFIHSLSLFFNLVSHVIFLSFFHSFIYSFLISNGLFDFSLMIELPWYFDN